MKYVSEYRNKEAIKYFFEKIMGYEGTPLTFMEVCGGHTMAIQRFGIPDLLPASIRLISGPGCPVCVTSSGYIDEAIHLARQNDTIIATYGDLIRVPGGENSLEQEKANGADVRIVYTSMDALNLAKNNPDKKVIFLGIGFETTAPASAVAIDEAFRQNTSNFFVLSAHKLMPPAMEALIHEGVGIDGYLAPGHVSVITGSEIYRFIAERYKLPVVISGFEPVDMLQSIYLLLHQIMSKAPKVDIQYRRAVKKEGNIKARSILNKVFEPSDTWWRGLGTIKKSGLKIKHRFQIHDAQQFIPQNLVKSQEPSGCICGEILKKKKKPLDCRLFGKVCHPSNPVGACMVSGEGTCHAYYKYQSVEDES